MSGSDTESLTNAAELGTVDLLVTDVARVLPVWEQIAGLSVLGHTDRSATLGTDGRPLVILYEGATGPRPPGTLGLFHIAFHVLDRRDLAAAAQRALSAGLRITGQDHLITQSLYFSDPDGNGIEIALETPDRGHLALVDGNLRATANDGTAHSMLEPLDVARLAAEADPASRPERLPDTAFLGHIHFRTSAREDVHAFYRNVLGLHPRANSAAAKFCEVGTVARPHMIVFNSWGGDNLPPPPPGTAGVLSYTIKVPTAGHLASARRRLTGAGVPLVEDSQDAIGFRDPEHNGVRLALAAA